MSKLLPGGRGDPRYRNIIALIINQILDIGNQLEWTEAFAHLWIREERADGEAMAQARKTAALPLKPVTRGTLPDEIYRQIRELILDGGIAPGELVTLQGLADAFGVSAMPVREALARLTAEKALTVVSGRSVGIPELRASRLEDL